MSLLKGQSAKSIFTTSMLRIDWLHIYIKVNSWRRLQAVSKWAWWCLLVRSHLATSPALGLCPTCWRRNHLQIIQTNVICQNIIHLLTYFHNSHNVNIWGFFFVSLFSDVAPTCSHRIWWNSLTTLPFTSLTPREKGIWRKMLIQQPGDPCRRPMPYSEQKKKKVMLHEMLPTHTDEI